MPPGGIAARSAGVDAPSHRHSDFRPSSGSERKRDVQRGTPKVVDFRPSTPCQAGLVREADQWSGGRGSLGAPAAGTGFSKR